MVFDGGEVCSLQHGKDWVVIRTPRRPSSSCRTEHRSSCRSGESSFKSQVGACRRGSSLHRQAWWCAPADGELQREQGQDCGGSPEAVMQGVSRTHSLRSQTVWQPKSAQGHLLKLSVSTVTPADKCLTRYWKFHSSKIKEMNYLRISYSGPNSNQQRIDLLSEQKKSPGRNNSLE